MLLKSWIIHNYLLLNVIFSILIVLVVLSISKMSKESRKKRQYFTPFEDQQLSEIIKNEDHISWSEISRKMEGKSPKQCRNRY
jgi:hypothetical protein